MTDLQFLKEKDDVKHSQAMDLEKQRLDNDLERKGADSLLGDTQSFDVTDIPPSSGSKLPKFAIGGDDLRGMDTPQENLADSMQI